MKKYQLLTIALITTISTITHANQFIIRFDLLNDSTIGDFSTEGSNVDENNQGPDISPIYDFELGQQHTFTINNYDENKNYQVSSENATSVSLNEDIINYTAPSAIPEDTDDDLVITVDGKEHAYDFNFNTSSGSVYTTLSSSDGKDYLIGMDSKLNNEKWRQEIDYWTHGVTSLNNNVYVLNQPSPCSIKAFSSIGQQINFDHSECQSQPYADDSGFELKTNIEGIFMSLTSNGNDNKGIWSLSSQLKPNWFLENSPEGSLINMEFTENGKGAGFLRFINDSSKNKIIIFDSTTGTIKKEISENVGTRGGIKFNAKNNALYFIDNENNFVKYNLNTDTIENKKQFTDNDGNNINYAILDVDSNNRVYVKVLVDSNQFDTIYRLSPNLQNIEMEIITDYSIMPKSFTVKNSGYIYAVGRKPANISSDGAMPALIKYSTNGKRKNRFIFNNASGGGSVRGLALD